MEAPHVVAAIANLFRNRGSSLYGGESVTQTEHALQAAHLAEQSGATPASIAAALLHDVGHLLHHLPDDAPDDGIDDVHEQRGERWLKRFFVAAVCDPVRLHVHAKRYLCAVEPDYLATLSPTSLQSLKLQGGPITDSEARQFEGEPYFQESVQLRRWDDQAKIPALATPDLAHFLRHVPACYLHRTEVEATL